MSEENNATEVEYDKTALEIISALSGINQSVVFEADEEMQQKFIDEVNKGSKFLKYKETKDSHEVDYGVNNKKMKIK